MLPYKALGQLLRTSYVSILVAPPKLLDDCATFMGNIVFALCEDQLLYPYGKVGFLGGRREKGCQKKPKSLELTQENVKNKS